MTTNLTPSKRSSTKSNDGAKSVAPSGEPIAIVGMACRFPGAENLDKFWALLEEGGNSVTEGVPGSGVGRLADVIRDSTVQSEACRYGAFVDDIDKFDASFFRISPVEAELLDPQQRMMLETSWEALEDAGINPLNLKGSLTGMYTGISNDEYRMLVLDTTRPTEAAGSLYALSGTNLNGTAGRVSFVLGLMGPAKAVDAACASALVAVTDAVADLQQGKSDLAIAAGVQAILNGRIYELRAEAMMLSPDGQCKTFDASADGYVRGEGCGVVVLKRLSDAERDGDRIWAVIKGAAVNHGGDSVGLTVPNPPALKQVMETALSDAGVLPSDVDFLEAHGTGTAVGDPIELEAVADVYCQGRPADNPLLIGSVKTNIGHLESAAGIAGLIKAALALKHRVIPKQLHFNDPNPRVDWDNLPLKVTTEMIDWQRRGERPRVAGVNCFGISGTNSHIVVQEHLGSDREAEQDNSTAGSSKEVAVSLPSPVSGLPVSSENFEPRQARFLPLSGKSDGALKDLAQRYLSWLDEREPELSSDGVALGPMLSDMSWTAGVGRSHFERRASAVFRDTRSLRDQLGELAQSDRSIEPRAASKVAFIYTGQGSQWVGMGQVLYESEPVARAVMDRCEKVFREVRGASLLDVMFGRNGADENLGDTAWEQPALYTLECALTALWSSVGVRPSVVLGHSVGEIAAAQAAGVFSLEGGMRFAAARGTLMSQMAQGTMAAIFAPPAQVAAEVDAHNAVSDSVGLSIAADNGAHQVVSGPVEDIEAIVERFDSLEIRARRLNTTKAFHSALVDPILGGLEEALQGLEIESPTLTFVSNLTGQEVEPGLTLDADYWKRHARQAVAFASGVSAMAEQGVDVVVEIGPHDILGTMATLAWPDAGPPAALASLRRPPRDGLTSEPETSFIDAVAAAYESGLDVHFDGLFAGEKRRRISLPSYPFQRERYWVEQTRQRRANDGHALLGVRRESARGEITFETELFPSDPSWLNDHRVFGRLIAPGALYGAMAASVSLADASGPVAVEDMQLHNALVFSENEAEGETGEAGRTVQVLLDDSERTSLRSVQIFSKGAEDEWTMHVEARVSSDTPTREERGRVDLEAIKLRLEPADVPAYYRAKADTGINLGPLFRTLGNVWSGPGEALGEVILPEALGRNEFEVHPLILDGCFQVVGVARNMTGSPGEATYLPFGWERLWMTGRLPDRVVCHVLMNEAPNGQDSDSETQPEVLSGELRIYDPSGVPIGGLSGYTVKRATRAALLSAFEGVNDLLYQVDWRESVLESGLKPANFFPSPETVATQSQLFPEYLSTAGVDPKGRTELLADLEWWSRSYALRTLEKLGWQRNRDDVVRPGELQEQLGVKSEHSRLFLRMFEMLAQSGVLEQRDDGFVVLVGEDEQLPDGLPSDPEEFHKQMIERYPHGLTETGLFRRSGAALADVLLGREDPLTLLFSSGEPTAADLYLKAPVARAANRMLEEAFRTLLARLPDDRRLRVIEIGAGTGSATASVLPLLPQGRFDYIYTDISAGFFAEAEERFGDGDGCIEYLTLDIENDPIAQGFDAHGYDIVLASNVLHATRYLEETLAHCRELLAPSGQLVALENLRGLGWMDLTFGQLDGWWRFADSYRPHHALATPAIWRQALGDVGFEEVEVLGVDDTYSHEMLDKGVIVAQGPATVTEQPGLWVLAADDCGVAEKLASEMAARNQTVILVGADAPESDTSAVAGPAVVRKTLDFESRESWHSLIEGLPKDVPFSGVVHLRSLEGHGYGANTEEITEDVRLAGASALALVQGVSDSDTAPAKGIWFITRGAQVLERERTGELAGSILWGLGKVVSLEAAHLQPRMIDLDPIVTDSISGLVDDLLYPDRENHIAYRTGRRLAARLVRSDDAPERLTLPEDPDWVLAPDREGVFDRPEVKLIPKRTLEPKEVLVSVEATGLNFWDVFRSLGFIEEGDLGRELSGQVLDIGSEVSTVSVGDSVVGLGFGAFAPEMVTREELVAPAPQDISVSALATIPSAFVSAELSYRLSGLEAGDRVLIHAGSGGVGLAAIQLAQAAGAEVFATASEPKQAYLRSLGVNHIFDSRQTRFGEEILEATGGKGVDVVLNSLTSEGFIDASLSCLALGGRFVELARRDILSVEEMAALRPDVKYDILELDVLKKTDPAWVGEVLRDVMARISSGELQPLFHSRWPLAEAGAALDFMRSARHIGKIVLTHTPLVNGQLRKDRSYLVTGGLGGIGIAVAEWLADHGAGTIVLNGRRDPDPEALEAIEALRQAGVEIEVELADMTDTSAIDAMMERIDAKMPPLAGVIHSVGVLADAALTNQTWASFDQVLSPKIVGAWHLHRATMDRNLDLFILFSSRVGVMGNPGQANHAAANAFLDQLAGHRRAMGLPGQSIAWGAWSEIGEAAEQRERIEERRAALGGRWFTPQQGLRALERLVRQDITNSVVMSMDWSVFEEAVEDRPTFLEDLLQSEDYEVSEETAMPEDVLSRLRGALTEEPEELLVSFLQQEVQAVLRLSTAPSPTVGFIELGMDSLMAVELRNRLNRAFSGEITVSNTAVFDYPDIERLANQLADELSHSDEGADVPAVAELAAPEQRMPVGIDDDTIAVVGMACRFPGASDLAAFWELLETGADAVTTGRRDTGSLGGAVGASDAEDAAHTRGAFVDDVDHFDSRFFRIAPIEARTMDPQQRMLLETTWQALEDAGVAPDHLRGSRTGVYAGVGASEYRDLFHASNRQHDFLGTTGSVAVGRVAFALGLEGPAMPIDMACASSLAAVHQAVVGLQRGEVDLALAGGVNAVLSPSVSNFMMEVGMLSPTGQCSPFDAAADGYVRGEGCGVVVLKRLSDAQSDGDRIWAVIRGSAVNQNGASAGLTAPNGPSQERVMREALEQAGVSPSDVDYLEAHAVGSQLGDPIELNAAATVYGNGRDIERPLLIGSVKSNIGHMESAAGVAALIKTVLSMNRGVIPKHLHFKDPNPNVEWTQIPVQVTTEKTGWPNGTGRLALAGVNAFGLSGANAHVLVEGYAPEFTSNGAANGKLLPSGGTQAIPVAQSELVGEVLLSGNDAVERSARLLPLSGKSTGALHDLAERYLTWLNDEGGEIPSEMLSDMAWTAGIGRNHFDYRAGVVFDDAKSLRKGLASITENDGAAGNGDPKTATRIAFLFSGENSLNTGICKDLYDSEPIVRAVLDRCDAVVQAERGSSLLDVMFGHSESDSTLSDPAWVQPALYSLECALTELWASIGIRPNAVLGHGAGEIAAARAAGALTLEDGLRFVLSRGTLMAVLPGVDPNQSLRGLEAAFADIAVASPSLTLVSGTTGQVIDSNVPLDGAYWRAQARETALHGNCATTLAELGIDAVLEIGPNTSLGSAIRGSWPESGGLPIVLSTLGNPASESEPGGSDGGYVMGVAGAYEAGLDIIFTGLFAGEVRRRISIPSYPFQRRRHWI